MTNNVSVYRAKKGSFLMLCLACGAPNECCTFVVIVLKEGLQQVVHTDNVSKARDQARAVLQVCKEQAVNSFSASNPEASMNALLECVNTSVHAAVEAKKDEITFQQNLRFEMGSKLGSYSCVDPNVTMATSIENKTWSHDGTVHDVEVLFDRPASIITFIRNFVTQEECDGIQAAVTLADADGANGLFARKGGVDIPFEERTNKITTLAHRMYAYAADVLRLQLKAEDAEQMFLLHYPGKVDNPSRYDAHCDGRCDGSQHTKGDRVATMIAYCETAKKGGHTHFNNAGIHVIPEKYSAVFVGYIDPTTNELDSGFTQHTGCGVVEGDKKIVTHKIRL
jgi:hypothetical protein